MCEVIKQKIGDVAVEVSRLSGYILIEQRLNGLVRIEAGKIPELIEAIKNIEKAYLAEKENERKNN